MTATIALRLMITGCPFNFPAGDDARDLTIAAGAAISRPRKLTPSYHIGRQ